MYYKNLAYDIYSKENKKIHKKRQILKFPYKRQRKKFKINLCLRFSLFMIVTGILGMSYVNDQVKISELHENLHSLREDIKKSENLNSKLSLKKNVLENNSKVDSNRSNFKIEKDDKIEIKN
ncbi:MAG: hypothetical protein RsTaC01_0064 [Candidatus Paraimprobicoccus trichonymphae]|uniref:Uncharacterized protein n=1 Tax=Candidatus Paraimprobicoccus trichonymphae TaxID=3033793 RepID=A0AA48KVW4_9FIRM|nr:MAG: hypothetical protein RsTaC01_0064 [Candidatus Paraimprobicoccus trichonymphae]